MKKLSIFISVTSVLLVVYCLKVSFFDISHEDFAKPRVENLISEPEETFLALDKNSLVVMLKSTLSVYSHEKDSTDERIIELKNIIVLLISILGCCVSTILFQSFKKR